MQRGAVCVQCVPECRRTDTPRNMVLAAVLCALLVPACAGYNMLVLLPYPGRSHHMVFAPLLDELVRRQHNLTVVSFFPEQPPHPNRRDVSLVGLAPLSVEVVDLKSIDVKRFFGFEKAFADISLITDLAKSNLRLCEKLLYSEPFQEFVEGRGEYDVILVEHFNSDCMMGLIYNYGLPSVGLMSSPFLPWTPSRLGAPDNPSYVPGMTLAVTDDMTFVERIENAFTLYLYKWWFEVFIRWEEQALLERRLGRKLPPLAEVAANTSALLVNTHYSLSGARVMPPAFVEVGGIHLYNKTVQPLPEDLEKWVSEAEDGFILFSFGSLIRGSSLPPKRVDAILKVFASLPQRVVWKWEADTIENLPSNVRIMKWLPQYDLINHPGCVALVTHAGLLSLTEAAAAGVPAVPVAVLGDQFGNAAHARVAARAPALTLAQLDEEHFRDAIKQALSPENRAAAKRLSAKFVSRPVSPLALAVFYTEQSARHGGLHMSSHARRLTLLQVSMLDVLSTVLALLLGAAMLCRCCCARCYKLRRGDKPKLT